MKLTRKQQQLLIRQALQWSFTTAPQKQVGLIRQQLATILREQFDQIVAPEGQRIIDEVEAHKSGTRSPPGSLLWLLGFAGLCAWARKYYPSAQQKLGDVGLIREIRNGWRTSRPSTGWNCFTQGYGSLVTLLKREVKNHWKTRWATCWLARRHKWQTQCLFST
jgi:hypothetical protein